MTTRRFQLASALAMGGLAMACGSEDPGTTDAAENTSGASNSSGGQQPENGSGGQSAAGGQPDTEAGGEPGGSSGGQGEGGSGGQGEGGNDGQGGSGGQGEGGNDEQGGSGGQGEGGSSSEDPDSLCIRGCELTLEADCPLGPQTQALCVEACEQLEQGPCADSYALFQECADEQEVTCNDVSGIPQVASCASEQEEFIRCLGQR